MDIHEAVGQVMKVTEEELVQASEPMVDAPMPVEEPVGAERPEITPELIASLVEQMPELGEVEQEKLINGINAEMEHFETVGGDIAIIAKVAFDHMKEFPNADYYAALAEMENQLREPTPEDVGADALGDEIQQDVEGTQTPRAESPFESVKESSDSEPKDDEQSEMKKEANKKAEDKINKEEVDK